jgi:site-specific DNA recombinase
LTKTGQTIDRYLAAFEHGTMDEDLVAGRLTQLRTKTTQLRARREELTLTLDDEPTTPEPATLTQIANHITEIITSGTHNQTKALVEALVAKVTITAPDRLIPIFRIPQPNHHHKPATTDPPGKTTPTAAVRTMTKSVGRVGLEPTT